MEAFERGRAALAAAEHESAIACFTEAIRLEPRSPLAYNNRALAHAACGDFDKAFADLDRAIELAPGQAYPFLTRGTLYARVACGHEIPEVRYGFYAKALEDLNQAIRLEPSNPGAHNNRGNCYQEIGALDMAIADFTEVIRLAPERAAIGYFNRAGSYGLKDDWGNAIADLDRVLELEPKHELAYMRRGIAHAQLSRPGQAIADLSAAIQLNPGVADYYLLRAESYRAVGDESQACSDEANAALSR